MNFSLKFTRTRFVAAELKPKPQCGRFTPMAEGEGKGKRKEWKDGGRQGTEGRERNEMEMEGKRESGNVGKRTWRREKKGKVRRKGVYSPRFEFLAPPLVKNFQL